jgi:hypothetical protein
VLAALLVVQLLVLLPLVWTGPAWATALYVVTLMVLGGLIAWVVRLASRPLVYRIEGDLLVVPAHFRPVRVPLRGARVWQGRIGGVRVAGTAMPPFCLGLFADRDGTYHASATASDGVWVQGARRVFVTPADVPGFSSALARAGAERIDVQPGGGGR